MVLIVLDNKWNLIECHTSLPKNEFLDAIKLVLNSTYFKFNNKIYRQLYGAPMGSLLSLIDLALQNLELHMLDKLSFNPPFYIRYVDNIVLAAPCTLFDELLDTFHSLSILDSNLLWKLEAHNLIFWNWLLLIEILIEMVLWFLTDIKNLLSLDVFLISILSILSRKKEMLLWI